MDSSPEIVSVLLCYVTHILIKYDVHFVAFAYDNLWQFAYDNHLEGEEDFYI